MTTMALMLLTACTSDSSVAAQPIIRGTVVRDISLHSEVLDRDMFYSVYLPAGYTPAKQYPVLYLLHGYGGDQNDWWVFDDLADDADGMIASQDIPEMVIVTPDGGTWMYIDNCYGNGINYEQYFFEELVPEVETRYSIRRQRSSRVIGGFSMGGYGALRYGVVHHDLFCYVYAMSSVIGGYGAPDMGDIIVNYDVSSLPGITLECGDRDYFTYDNREFAQLLEQHGVPYEHIERSGGHDWTFWSACSPKILQKAGKLFSNNMSSISEMSQNSSELGPIYGIDGKHRIKLQPGINIMGGKKILVK